MLEQPDLPNERIVTSLQDSYDVLVAELVFLPLGADQNTAVYRVVADDQTPYFLKLRRGIFDELSVLLPAFLSEQGIAQVIAPLKATRGQLWAPLDIFTATLYPFVLGHNGYTVALSDRHWVEFGTALKRIHTVVVPPSLSSCIQREMYTPHWREAVKILLERVADEPVDDPVATELVTFLMTQRERILDLVRRADRLAQALIAASPQVILCHSDLHAGNILIDAHDALYIVDWDNPILAPKERDLMFVGGGQGFIGHSAQEEESLFYQGYGQTQIDPIALAYYRYERIIQDIAVFCEEILLTPAGSADRAQSLHYLISNFLPNNTIEVAYMSDKTLSER